MAQGQYARRLAREHHPDANPSAEAEARIAPLERRRRLAQQDLGVAGEPRSQIALAAERLILFWLNASDTILLAQHDRTSARRGRP